MKDFAAGRLLATTPEGCLVTDASGRLAKASASAAASTAAKCADPPPFGLTPTSAALASAALAEIDLVHEGVGANLNTALVLSTEVAACRSRVAAERLKCSDFRKREYVKCLKRRAVRRIDHGRDDPRVHVPRKRSVVAAGSHREDRLQL